MFLFWGLILTGYLIGSVSSAILACRVFGLADPRSQGSGNPGATNMARLGHKKLAAAVFLGDFLKGVLVVLVARFFLSEIDWGWIGLAGVTGHVFPLFFRFKGGKGVATGAGVLTALYWPLGLSVLAGWLSMAIIFRYSSLAAVFAAVLAVILTKYWLPENFLAVLIMALLILYRHRGNIQRLINGQESKI